MIESKWVRRAVVACAVVVGAAGWFAVGWNVARDVADDVARAKPAVEITRVHVTTVPVPVAVPAAPRFAEDSLPVQMYRWIESHPGADLFGPGGGSDAWAPGHHGCYVAIAGVRSLTMCPDGHWRER